MSLDGAGCGSDHCITCSDEGVPMLVLSLGGDGLALCRADGGEESEVEISLVDARAGDTVLVHAGVALLRLDPAAEPAR